MTCPLELNVDRLFPADPTVRSIARELYDPVRTCPIVSPHGHCDPRWFAENASFSDPTSLLVTPDHYLTRMLYSQGVPLTALGVTAQGQQSTVDPRVAWQLFARHYHLFAPRRHAFGLTRRSPTSSAWTSSSMASRPTTTSM